MIFQMTHHSFLSGFETESPYPHLIGLLSCIIWVLFFRLAPAGGTGRLAPAEEILVCVDDRLS